jgi:hypothetical protein
LRGVGGICLQRDGHVKTDRGKILLKSLQHLPALALQLWFMLAIRLVQVLATTQ